MADGGGQYHDFRRYRFGTAAFDEARSELYVDGKPAKIDPNPAVLLRVLLRRHDQFVSRDQLRQAVWNRPNVTDNAINMTVSRLYDSLGPDNAPRIVVRPKRGYCLTGPVDWEIVGIRVDSKAVMRVEHPATVDDTPVRSLLKFITDSLIDPANPAVTGRTNAEVVRLARAAAAQIDATVDADRPDIRTVLHREMQGLFSQLAEFDQAIAHGRAALQAATMRHPPDPQQVADIQLALARDLIQLSRLDEAGALIAASDRLISTAGLRRSALQVRLLLERGRHAIGALTVREAVGHLDQAAALEQTLPDRNPDLGEHVAFELAQACWLAADYAHAEPVARRLMIDQTDRFGAASARAAYSAVLLANILAYADRCDEAAALLDPAIETLTDALGADDRRTVMGRNVLANIAFKQRQYGKAAAVWRGLKEHFTRFTGAESLGALVNDNNIALALQRGGEKAEAERIIRETLAVSRVVFGEEAPLAQLLKYELGDLLLDAGKADEAAPLLAGLDPGRLKEAKIQDDWPGVLRYQDGRIAALRGDLPRALTLLEQAADMLADAKDGGPIEEADVRARIRQLRQKG